MSRRYLYRPGDEPSEDVQGVPVGLVARPMYPWRTDDAGRPTELVSRRVTRFQVHCPHPPHPAAVPRLVDSLPSQHQRFLLHHPDATGGRLTRRYKDRLWAHAVDLARTGLVTLTVGAHPQDASRLGPLLGWHATPPIRDLIHEHRHHCALSEHTDRHRAEVAAAALATVTGLPCPPDSLNQALHAAADAPRLNVRRLRVLTAAATALRAGSVYGGIQQFSQAHFHDSKLINADKILDDAHVDRAIRECLGVFRYGEISFGGPITITNPVTGATASSRGIPGPWTLPADPRHIRLDCHHAPLVVVENKDPARHLSRTRPDLPVWFLAGYTGPTQLQMLAQLATTAASVTVITDADADGVRIAAQVLAYVPTATLVDLGTHPHHPRTRSPSPTRRDAVLGPLLDSSATSDQLRTFAQAVHTRGYDVEQDAVTTRVLERLWGTHPETERIEQAPADECPDWRRWPIPTASAQDDGAPTPSPSALRRGPHACPTCGHEPADEHEAEQHRADLAEVWLKPDGHDGVIEVRHCVACQPHNRISSVDCVLCASGPLLTDHLAATAVGDMPAGVQRWLINHGWHRDKTAGWICGEHREHDASDPELDGL
jgi:hypothetical protein